MTGHSSSHHASVLSASHTEKRRNFSKRQNLRRQVYREMTSYQIFPLQAMAIDDFDKNIDDYFNGGVVDETNDDSDGSESSHRLPGQRQSVVERVEDDNSSVSSTDSDGDRHLRQQFKREFLIEKLINASAVVIAEDIRGDSVEASMFGKEAKIGQVDDPTQCETSGGAMISIETNTTALTANENDSNQINMAHDIQTTVQNVPETESSFSPNSDDLHAETSPVRPQFLSTLWSMEPRLFAMETSMKGKRRYISSHLGRFMDHYWRECDVYSRHYYELIRENTPCRLYFDLEFNKSSNPQLTPTITEAFLTQLFNELRHQFQHSYSIAIERRCMVDLDASTPTKFSRHWLLHLPNGELFSDAREVGIFVKAFVSRLEAEKESGVLQSRNELLSDHLLVNADTSCSNDDNPTKKLTRIIDLGVYTRNRIFRLMGSTKFGKPTTSALRIAEANEFPFPNGFNNAKFYQPEMGKVPPDCDHEDAADNDDFENFCNSLCWEYHADALAATLVVPANSSKMNFPILKDPSVIFIDDANRPNAIPSDGSIATVKFPRATPLYGASPFPVLERFILDNLGSRGDVVGRISTWSIGTQQPLPRTVCFNMKDNRYCDNIGRAHKSNNIIWNVHLGDRICWQSCHDPECRGYRGEPIDLPEEVNVEIDEYFLEYELSLLIEDEVVESKQDEHATRAGIEAFGESTLDAAMRQLDISHAAQVSGGSEQSFDDESLDNELAKLNLSDFVASDRLINPSSITETTTINRCNAKSSELRKNNDHLDLELAMLKISEFE